MNTLTTDSHIQVTAIGFDRAMHAYPKRMEWQGITYRFIDSGLRVRRGQSHGGGAITMSDGQQSFCFTKKAGSWTLVGIY